jgi:hypothetical protein
MTDDEREAQTKLAGPPTGPAADWPPAPIDSAPGDPVPAPGADSLAADTTTSAEPEAQSKVLSPNVAGPLVMRSAPLKPSIPVVPEPAWPPLPIRSPARIEPPSDTGLEDPEADAVPLTLAEKLRRLPPAPVILTAGSIGSLLFLARAVTSHTTPVAVLLSSAVVTGLIFGVDSAISSVATWRAAQDGEPARALFLALIGGVAAVVCAGAFAGTLVMILVLGS